MSDDGLNQTKTKEQIIAEKYSHLAGHPITIAQAAETYQLQIRTIRRWIEDGYIATVDDNYPIRVNEADVAACAYVYYQRQVAGIRTGIPLFDEHGRAYDTLKHPDLSKYRRQKRQKQTTSEV